MKLTIITINRIWRLSYVIVLSLCLASCSNEDASKLDQITLSPSESKDYSWNSKEPMRVGILLNQEVSGGTVELQQVGSVSFAGTSYYWISRLWEPENNKVELKLVNNSQTRVEVIVFDGQKPSKSWLQ